MNQTKFKYTNKLIDEKSPYLLQHAHNPVNWFPWGEEAFELARKENKPIFLSIGYSTCHWCHVMEHESFEDEEVAKAMNEVFISIKVDREERPDIDNIYMSVCQMLTGSGGWPMTIIMTPDKKPFFAGTYFPKNSFSNRMGMIELIAKIDEAWKNQRKEIDESAENIVSHLNSVNNIISKEFTNEGVIDTAFRDFSNRFDEKLGGFGNRPKFPSPHNLSFLLRYYDKTKNESAKFMVEKTLTEMRKGGIYDQVGFGFHRYSTDANWLIPHFEKMLYDQAMLILAYTEAYQVTKNDLFKRTVDETITYILRDMTSPEGGFFSAEDADSEGKEGKFYVWEKSEIIKILGKEDGDYFCKIFNITDKGNYFEEASGKSTGTNIPHLTEIINNDKIEKLRVKLFIEREKRIHPYKDDKILTDWNGLMITALAKAGRVFENGKYLNAAEQTYEFIAEKLVNTNGELLHRFRNNDAAIKAHIDDYAFLTWASLELYETTFKFKYLQSAINFTNILIKDFWDKENNNGFYFTSEDNSDLISRPKEFYDGAIPSGNSVTYNNLLKLYKLTSEQNFNKYAELLNKAFKTVSEKSPTGFGEFLSGLNFSVGPSQEIILVGEKENDLTKEMLKIINDNLLPNKVVMLLDKNDEAGEELIKLAPFLKDYEMIDGKTTAYVCKNYVCSLPTNDLEKLKSLLSL
ncbi:MAG: thioredoxin domain-containing protein [Ignavibacteriales bacterium]|nr:thioredoxin domain-containing protein [Ignavibacteriales bacterium]